MSLVDNDQVPVRCPQQLGHDLLALGEIERGDAAVLALPRVSTQLPACEVRVDDREVLVELLVQLVLPLHRQRRGAQDEHSIGNRPQPQLLDQQPGHDRLAGGRVIGKHEPQPRLGKHVPVHRRDLVWQTANPGKADREVRVMRVGQRDAVGLHEVKKVSLAAALAASAG